MDDLRATLSAQFKFVEALSIGEKSLSLRARLYKDLPDFQANLESQKEDLQRQNAFRAAAEKLLGPRESWLGSEDGQPAKLMFQETVREASAKRSNSGAQAESSSSRSSRSSNKKADPECTPVQFDVSDEADVNYGALMAGMGITRIGLKKVKVGGKRDEEIALQTYGAGDLTGVEGIEQSNKIWAMIITLMRNSMTLPGGPPFSEGDTKRACLVAAFDANKTWMDEVQDAVRQASESKEVHRQQEEERANAEAKGGQDGEPEGPLGRRTKPVKICIGCGACGAHKKCSRCEQAYVCSSECFNAAWHAFHKHTCVRRKKK
ncbi:hypothetical protein DUNSADRAFT_271 [Dunaliella salina]|uniref:MYND-type domain-containing protein n=1 Tax=Dunaliella salina TaxID=3046 RepID=A0ABQ7FZ89_DUNSA|nr:hypothetical protein DUNSADRAFT_271 [Dunaliella salina]KAF5827665.1 hypothetical protein DUNSADRAFT_271 [Dunaliella salina]|eukprot:KAF5827664.1 hypothetical protein DUNSADRAFT_271 [Dunaliella salina]